MHLTMYGVVPSLSDPGGLVIERTSERAQPKDQKDQIHMVSQAETSEHRQLEANIGFRDVRVCPRILVEQFRLCTNL